MDKKAGLIRIIPGICGIIGGILLIIAAIMENDFPRPLWFVAAGCVILNGIGILVNFCYVRRQEKAATLKKCK